ncbi:Peroxidase 73 [Orobanche gracilis]
MGQLSNFLTALLSLTLGVMILLSVSASAQLRHNYYKNTCPDVENIVGRAVTAKFKQTFVTVPSGCDASVIIASTPDNEAEKDHPDNLSLAGDGFDTVIKAKAAVDAVSRCRNKVSCADILALATRDVIVLVRSGGPSYQVELGRMDGLRSTAASVNGNLPHPNFNLDQLNAMFASRGLSQADMIALSACHTVGFSHCGQFSNRIYNYSRQNQIDPTLNKEYATELQGMCPRNVDPRVAIDMDPITPRKFDNAYFQSLVQGKGLFTSDQILFTDSRSRNTVTTWASNSGAFNASFVKAITKLGQVGVKTKTNGNIRLDCGRFN